MRRGLIAFSIALSAASPAFAASQQELNSLADRMGVRLQILDNKPANCPGQDGGCFLSELDLGSGCGIDECEHEMRVPIEPALLHFAVDPLECGNVADDRSAVLRMRGRNSEKRYEQADNEPPHSCSLPVAMARATAVRLTLCDASDTTAFVEEGKPASCAGS